MNKPELFTITVTRVNDGLHELPIETFVGSALEIASDGTLTIRGATGGAMTLSSWDRFELVRLPRKPD